jgi:hypothetical protein
MSVFFNDGAFRDADIEAIADSIHTMDEGWTLTPEQMVFMLEHHYVIELAFSLDDMPMLRNLAASREFIQLFPDMTFDEAYDRYETMIKNDKSS